MPKTIPWKGFRWGRLECIDVTKKDAIVYDSQGFQYKDTYNFYHFKCDCGTLLPEVREDLWKGVRETPDCGCGLAMAHAPKVTLSLQVPEEMGRKAKVTARNKGIGLSQWLRDCIQAGLDGRIQK